MGTPIKEQLVSALQLNDKGPRDLSKEDKKMIDKSLRD